MNAASRRPAAPAVFLAIIVLGVIALLLIQALSGETGSSPSKVTSAQSSSASYLSLMKTIPLPATQGRIDHMAVDLDRRLLFVASYGNNSVGIVDLRSGILLRSITGLNNPQGVAWVPGVGLFVSNAGDGTVRIYDGSSFALAGTISLSSDADNLRYDGGSQLLYIGYGSGGIATVNVATPNSPVTKTRALPGHPESFQVENSGREIFVNVPTSNLIVAYDKTTLASISNRSMTGNNFPMMLDESGGRLFVATRSPAELRVLDISTPSLTSVANVTIPGDPDDIFLDPSDGLVYVSCGQGFLEVIKQADANHYGVVQSIATGQGARTSLLVPELGWLFVAVPAGTGQAEILVFASGTANSVSASTTRATSTAPVPTAASFSVSPGRGPSGLLVALSGSGYFPGAQYQVCVGAFANKSCGLLFRSADYDTTIDEFAIMGSFTADSSGNIPAGTKMAVPDLFERNYSMGVVQNGGYSFFVSAQFRVVAPTLSVNATAVPPNGYVKLAGSGYAPSITYTVCMVPAGTFDCGYTGDREETPPGWHLGTFKADGNGNIPDGVVVRLPGIPAGGQFEVGVFSPSGGYILISLAEFTLAPT